MNKFLQTHILSFCLFVQATRRRHMLRFRCYDALIRGPCARCRHVSRLAVDKLPDIPYVMPNDSKFNAEGCGKYDKQWLADLPKYRAALRNAVYTATKEALWAAPMHESVSEIVPRMSYHDIARYIMENNFFHLLPDMLVAADAPLPHVCYEDMMKCKTFSSLQNPPEEHFVIEPALLRAILCLCAHHLITDGHYFGTCEALFRTIEQQQSVSKEVLSSWVFCCAAAGNVRQAIHFAKILAEQRMPFDPLVFSLMMHPSTKYWVKEGRLGTESAAGFIIQQRLQNRLSGIYTADSIAVHGMFTFYSLTLNHVKKWEVIRHAVEGNVELCDRTVELMLEVFAQEQGARCGPKTVKALVRCLAAKGSAANILFVLMRSRKNEMLPQFSDLAPAQFEDEEIAYVLSEMRARGRSDVSLAMAAPIAELLLRNDNPELLMAELSKAHRYTVASQVSQTSELKFPAMQIPATGRSDNETNEQGVCERERIETSGRELTAEPPLSANSVSAVETTTRGDIFMQALTEIAKREKDILQTKRKKRPARRKKTTSVSSTTVGSPLGPPPAREIVFSSAFDAAEAVRRSSEGFSNEVFLNLAERHEQESMMESMLLGKIRSGSVWVNPDL